MRSNFVELRNERHDRRCNNQDDYLTEELHDEQHHSQEGQIGKATHGSGSKKAACANTC